MGGERSFGSGGEWNTSCEVSSPTEFYHPLPQCKQNKIKGSLFKFIPLRAGCSIRVLVRKLKGILDDSHFPLRTREDFHDIKAERDIRHFQQAQPFHRAPDDESPLFLIHRVERSAEFLGGAGFHFNKDKFPAVTADEIDLATLRRAEIFPENFVTAVTQVPGSDLLTLPSEPDVWSLRGARLAQPAKNFGDEPDWGHARGVWQDDRALDSLCAGKIRIRDTEGPAAASPDPARPWR